MIEIERKFLVLTTDWGTPSTSRRIEQGYLFIAEDRSMRIRRSGDQYILSLKVRIDNLARHEIETDIDAKQGQAMLDGLCVGPSIQKIRHEVPFEDKIWEIDVFDGANAGLIVAEIELSSAADTFVLPSWVGPEVTDDPRFLNTSLSGHPFGEWGVSYAELRASKRND
jgi:adenylate cyclase